MQPNSDDRLLAQLAPPLRVHPNQADRLAQWPKQVVRTLIELVGKLMRRFGGSPLPMAPGLDR